MTLDDLLKKKGSRVIGQKPLKRHRAVQQPKLFEPDAHGDWRDEEFLGEGLGEAFERLIVAFGEGGDGNGSNPALDEFVCLAILPPSPSAPICPARRSCAGLFCRAASPCSPFCELTCKLLRSNLRRPRAAPPGRAVSPRAFGDIGAGRSFQPICDCLRG